MSNRYYAALSNGEDWTGATMHHDRDCTTSFLVPLSAAVIDSDAVEWCAECAGGTSDSSTDPDTEETATEYAAQIEGGECPWCDEYTGAHVGQHASSAHSEEWQEYRSG